MNKKPSILNEPNTLKKGTKLISGYHLYNYFMEGDFLLQNLKTFFYGTVP
jgi:hypothetical protein